MKQWGMIGLILVALLLLATLRGGGSEKALEIDTQHVKVGQLRSSVIASGSLIFRKEVQLRSEVIGKIIELAVVEGQSVIEGQLLLQLDPESYLAEVEQQQANVRLQEIAIAKQKQVIANMVSRWTRQQTLRSDGSIGEEDFETIDHNLKLARIDLQSREHSLRQARAQLSKAEDFLGKTRITSPLTGIVTALDAKVGETVITGTTNIVGSSLMTIAAPKDIIAEVYVDEADIANVALLQSADIYAVAYPNKPISGEVEVISSTARLYPGRNGLSFKVTVRLASPEATQLFSGMSCRAEIFRENSNDLITVPIESVLFEDGDSELDKQAYVYVMEADEAVKRKVVLGASSDDSQAIESGLLIDERLIVGPHRSLKQLKNGRVVKSNER